MKTVLMWVRINVALRLLLLLAVSRAAALESAVPTNSPAWQGSAGLFVGVRQFEPDSGLGQLRYTTEDAVALAYLFTAELKLLPPQNVWLALSGPPESATQKANLKALQKLGINESPANREDLLKITKLVAARAAHEDGLLLAALSSHGYESGGRMFLMPANGSASDVETMGVPMDFIKNTIRKARASKRLMFIDACRQSVQTETRGDSRMTEAFYKALSAGTGFGQLTSCNLGQQSFEDEELGHGVFTYHLLEALRGKAKPSPKDGFIYFREVASYTTTKTKDYVWQHKSAEQDPWFDGDTSAFDIPLAMDPAQLAEIKQLRATADAALLGMRETSRQHSGVMPAEMLAELGTRLDGSVGEELQRLIRKCQAVIHQKNDRETLVDFVAWYRGAYPKDAGPQESSENLRAASKSSVEQSSVSPGPTQIFQPKTGAVSVEKPSLYIQFDSVSSRNSRLWSSATMARFRDQLSQAFRDLNSFAVRNTSAETRTATRNSKATTDFILTVRVDDFSHDLEPRQAGTGFLKITTGAYDPKSRMTMGWGLSRSADGQELKTDSVTAVATGPAISPPPNKKVSTTTLSREAQWNDAALFTDAAAQIASAVTAAYVTPSQESVRNSQYSVIVMLPSAYNNPVILVDNLPANIVNQSLGRATILVSANVAHQLKILNNNVVVREQSFFAHTNNTVLKPFQY